MIQFLKIYMCVSLIFGITALIIGFAEDSNRIKAAGIINLIISFIINTMLTLVYL